MAVPLSRLLCGYKPQDLCSKQGIANQAVSAPSARSRPRDCRLAPNWMTWMDVTLPLHEWLAMLTINADRVKQSQRSHVIHRIERFKVVAYLTIHDFIIIAVYNIN